MPNELKYKIVYKYRVPAETTFRIFVMKEKTTKNSYEIPDHNEIKEVMSRLPQLDSTYKYYLSSEFSDSVVYVGDPNNPDPTLTICFDVVVQEQYRRRRMKLREMCWGPTQAHGPWHLAIVDASNVRELSDVYFRFWVLPEYFDTYASMGLPFYSWQGCIKVETQNPGTTYQVRAGDTLSAIAQKCGVSLNSLMRVNNIYSDSALYGGQVLIILPGDTAVQIVDHMYSTWPTDGCLFDQRYRWQTFNREFFKTPVYNMYYENVTKRAQHYVCGYRNFREFHSIYKFGDTFDGVERIRQAIHLPGPDQINYETHESDRDFWYFTVPEIEIGAWDLPPAQDKRPEKKHTTDLPSMIRTDQNDWKCSKMQFPGKLYKFYLTLPYDYRYRLRIYDIAPGSVYQVMIDEDVLIQGRYDPNVPEYVIDSVDRTISPNIVNNLNILNFNIAVNANGCALRTAYCKAELTVNPIQYSLDYV